MAVSACILSVSGPVLNADEKQFLRDAQPWGLILMGRSCQSRDQVQALIADIHTALGREALIFVDQEGGRVARLRPPEWPKFPPAATYGSLYESDPEMALQVCQLGHQLLGWELAQIGIRADCAPCADLRQADTHDAIGDRSFGYQAKTVAELAAAALNGLALSGVAGCIKHLPGQGRATVDSHYDLPRVTASVEMLEADFSVFAALAKTAPMAMTGHVVFEAFDAAHAATLSPTIISDVIRDRIGFDGLLMTDDLGMDALGDSLQIRGEAALQAGCDVLLHCSGFLKDPGEILSEMQAVATAAGPLEGRALERANSVTEQLPTSREIDRDALWMAYEALIADGLTRPGV